jgi:hypothetical protein
VIALSVDPARCRCRVDLASTAAKTEPETTLSCAYRSGPHGGDPQERSYICATSVLQSTSASDEPQALAKR